MVPPYPFNVLRAMNDFDRLYGDDDGWLMIERVPPGCLLIIIVIIIPTLSTFIAFAFCYGWIGTTTTTANGCDLPQSDGCEDR